MAEPDITDETATARGANAEQSGDTDTGEVPPAETVNRAAVEPGFAAKGAPTVPARHQHMQPGVEPASTITESLV